MENIAQVAKIVVESRARRLGNLFGPDNKECRRHIVLLITGQRRPLSKCGVNEVFKVVKEHLESKGHDFSKAECLAHREDMVHEALISYLK
jgi:hypothetical protein